MTPPTDATATGLKEAIAELTDVQRKAIVGAIFVAGDWTLTTQYEDHPDIVEHLSESIADPVSGIFTAFGTHVRDALIAGGEQ